MNKKRYCEKCQKHTKHNKKARLKNFPFMFALSCVECGEMFYL